MLDKTLPILNAKPRPRPHVMITLHRELAMTDQEDPDNMRRHLLATLEGAVDDDSLVSERAQLGDPPSQEQHSESAWGHYRAAPLFAELARDHAHVRSSVAARVDQEEQ